MPVAKLTLRIYNYAGVAPGSLAFSEKVAGTLLQTAGVELAWADCPVSKADLRSYPTCPSEMGTTDLVLRILPRRMAAKLPSPTEPLGSAQTCSVSEPACEVTVFYHRVDDLAVKGYRADLILGYVIAHEVTHVLLGPGHSAEGIMRGEWSPADLQRISWGLRLNFTRDQSRQLRLAVLQRTMPSIQQAPAQTTSVAP